MKKPALREIANQSVLTAAFQRVCENGGCAGVDGITLEKFSNSLKVNIDKLMRELLTKSYQPLPLLRIVVDKGNGEARTLSIPTVKDRVTQTAVLDVIGSLFDAGFEDCSYAYRKGRSIKQAVCKIREYYEDGYVWVVDADIDAFFDSIDHDILIGKVKRIVKDRDILSLINMWVKAEVWDGRSVKTLKMGIPQGCVIAPVLANLFLDKFDEELINRKFVHPLTEENTTWRKCFRIQAEALAAHIQNDRPYLPFELKE